MFYIYAIQNIKDGKMYIGYTKDPAKRWRKHISNAFYGAPRDRYYIHKAIKKHGVENFTFTVFQKFDDEKSCKDGEKYWIKFFNTKDNRFGYNLTDGGEGAVNRIVSKETREKLSRSKMGQKHTEATKIKMRANNTQKKLSDEDVIEIRQKYQTLNFTQKELADKYSVSPALIRRIIKNKEWTHLPMLPYPGKVSKKDFGSKLERWQAEEIREKYKNTDCTKDDLAKEYNINISAIREIISGTKFEDKDYVPPIKNDSIVRNKLNLKTDTDYLSNEEIHVGENNPNAKLTETKVIEIRDKFKNGYYSFKILADEYHVNLVTIRSIVKRRSWKNIQ